MISVDVYAGTSQNVTFELRDNNSQIIEDKTIFLQTGLNTLMLDFDLPVMNNIELGVSTTGTDLYRNNSGASYPYLLGTLASITGHNSPYAGDTNYHYFFYNLNIQESCLSNFSQTYAVFITPSEVNNFESSLIDVYPNPAVDKVFISSKSLISNLKIFDLSGKLCYVDNTISNQQEVDISKFSKGIYTINVIDQQSSYVRKLFVE